MFGTSGDAGLLVLGAVVGRPESLPEKSSPAPGITQRREEPFGRTCEKWVQLNERFKFSNSKSYMVRILIKGFFNEFRFIGFEHGRQGEKV